jgi:hypothetical protein
VPCLVTNKQQTTIGTSFVVSFVTNGSSAASALVKESVRVGAAVINNTVKVDEHFKVKTEKNLFNIGKNATIDLLGQKVTSKMGNSLKKTVSKVGITKAGRLNKTTKKIAKLIGNKEATRVRTENIKSGLKKTGTVAKHISEKSLKIITNKPKRKLKDISDYY